MLFEFLEKLEFLLELGAILNMLEIEDYEVWKADKGEGTKMRKTPYEFFC